MSLPPRHPIEGAPATPLRSEMRTVAIAELTGTTHLRQSAGDAQTRRWIDEHDRIVRETLGELPDTLEISARDGRFLLAFLRPSDAVTFALRLQSRLRARKPPDPLAPGDRVAIHVGEVLVQPASPAEAGRGLGGLGGLEVDRCERLANLAEPGRILLTRPAFDLARSALRGEASIPFPDLRWLRHGLYAFEGLAEPLEVCEVADRPPTVLSPPEGSGARQLPPPDGSFPAVTGWRRALGAALVAAFGILLLAIDETPLTTFSYDLAQLLPASPQVREGAVIFQDQRSFQAEGREVSQPWDRASLARLIDQLTDAHVRAIVVDSYFIKPWTNQPAADQALIAAARRHGRVFVAAGHADGSSDAPTERRAIPPFEGLREVVLCGSVWAPDNDRTRTRRQFDQVKGASTLPVLVATTLGHPPRHPRTWELWLRFYGPNGIPHFPFAEVIAWDPQRRTAELSDRIVFVGRDVNAQDPSRRPDLWRTPFTWINGPLMPGVELVATASLNLVRDDVLRRLSPGTESLLIALAGAGFVLLFARTRPLPGLALAGAAFIGLAATGITSTLWSNYWFPWLIVAAAQIPAAGAWCVLARLDLRGRRPHPADLLPASPSKPEVLPAAPPPPTNPPPSPVPVAGAAPTPLSDPPRTPVSPTPVPTPAGSAPGSSPGVHELPRPIIPDYDVLRLIGAGAYGEVWLCRSASGTYRAVKVVRRIRFTTDRPYEQEYRGIQSYEPISLTHPSLLAILHVGRRDADGYFFYIMELGDDIRPGARIDPDTYEPRNLAKDIRPRDHLPVAECLDLGEGLAGALAALHRNRLLHRDIKPANIIFIQGVPKLADIGLVTLTERDGASLSCVGTIGYMAPEGPRAPTSDIFGLGKVLYEASTGLGASEFPELPGTLFQRPDCREFLLLNDLVLRACALDARNRFQSALELQDALRSLRRQLADPPSSPPAPPEAGVPPPAPPAPASPDS